MIEHFIAYFTVLLLGYFNFKTLSKNNNLWELFNAMFSTINAVQCVYVVFKYANYKYYDLLYEGDDYVIQSLYYFAAYLFVDGIFIFSSTYRKPDSRRITSLLHHFVGGIGIFMIALNRKGLGLGLYFAGTELSTPLLNISWLSYYYNIKVKIIYLLFYLTFVFARILTIPLLISYLINNSYSIDNLSIGKYTMVYGGSSVLILLNLTWFIMLTKKLVSVSNK